MDYLNRHSYKPLYLQLSENLRQRIEGDDLEPGSRLPSENELVARYGVSRNTARQAINALIAQGLVYRLQGRGTFVAQKRLRYGVAGLTSFSEEMRKRGMQARSQILRQIREEPPAKVAHLLQLLPSEEVFMIERLRLANDEPMALNISYVPVGMCPDLDQQDLENGSLYDLFEQHYGFRLGYAEQVLKPATATEYEAEILHTGVGYPLLVAEGVTYLENQVPVEVTRLMYRGDRYEFVVQPVRQHHRE